MIEIEGLTFGFDERRAISDISLRISRDEYVLLVGANGAGKTTLLDHLSGLHHPDEGTVHVNGRDVTTEPVAARTAIGRVFEDPRDQILGANVAEDVAFGPENLGLPREEIDERVDDSLEAVGLDGFESTPVGVLSGGERARLAIAGALAMGSAYVVLDEPTSGVDHPGRTAILEHLRHLHQDGTGIILATHDLRDLRDDVDRAIGLADGRVVIDDAPETAADRLPDIGVRVPASWEA